MSNTNVTSADCFSKLITDGAFDFIDFGCSKGGSLLYGQQALGGKKGLGIDCAQSKVAITKAAGFDAVKFNIHEIPDKKLVRFVIMSHFLEHVPDLSDVKAFIKKACIVSSEFVYIQQPYFDADSYLARNGLKLFWSDWRGHPNRMTSLELLLILRDLRNEGLGINYSIHYRRRIGDSADARILSIFAPIDQHEYERGIHPGKPNTIKFNETVFAETCVVVTMPGVDHLSIVKKAKCDFTYINEKGNIVNSAENKKNHFSLKKKPGVIRNKFDRFFNKVFG